MWSDLFWLFKSSFNVFVQIAILPRFKASWWVDSGIWVSDASIWMVNFFESDLRLTCNCRYSKFARFFRNSSYVGFILLQQPHRPWHCFDHNAKFAKSFFLKFHIHVQRLLLCLLVDCPHLIFATASRKLLPFYLLRDLCFAKTFTWWFMFVRFSSHFVCAGWLKIYAILKTFY